VVVQKMHGNIVRDCGLTICNLYHHNTLLTLLLIPSCERLCVKVLWPTCCCSEHLGLSDFCLPFSSKV
jgi:hypothetical protein